MKELEYRAGVGLMILNHDKQVFIGERVNSPSSFQMPQGGIDDGEDIERAVYRELGEETGMMEENTSIISFIDKWIYHDFPDDVRSRVFNGRYKGQCQKWFLLSFNGDDVDIDLTAHDIQEFSSYKWVCPSTIPNIVVPFKRHVYRKVVKEFFPNISVV